MLADISVIILLILLNGFFAMAELAVISANRVRLQTLAKEGRRGAAAALELAENPGRFLSTIQIGITLIGILAGAYGGARFADPVAAYLATFPLFSGYSDALAFGLVVTVITYLTLVIGELLPKQIALHRAESIASFVAPPMNRLARLALPLVTALDVPTRLGLRLFGRTAVGRPAVSDEEIRTLIAEATRTGTVKRMEQAMIEGVMRLADRPVEMLMTPRPDITWLDANAGPDAIRRTIADSPYSRFPVGRGALDDLVGIVQAKDLLEQCLQSADFDLDSVMRHPLVIYEGASSVKLLDSLKRSAIQMALVVDEYGSIQGLVTPGDILESIVGEMTETGTMSTPDIVEREDGSWLVDGGLPTDELRALLQLHDLQVEGRFHTLAGLVLAQLGQLPTVGDHFDLQGYRFEVVDMDGHRIDRVWIRPQG